MNVKQLYGHITREIKAKIKVHREAQRNALKRAKKEGNQELVFHLSEEIRIAKHFRKIAKDDFSSIRRK